MNNEWLKTLKNAIPYLDYRSVSKERRYVWEGDRHSHGVCELHIILQGKAKIEIQETVIELKEGQAILIQPDTFHCNTQISNPFLRFTISFLVDEDMNLRSESEEVYRVFPVDTAISQICYDVFKECDQEDTFWQQEMISALLSELFIRVFRTLHQSVSENATVSLGDTSPFQHIDYFFSVSPEKQFKDDSRKALTKTLHCSERQLNRVIYSLYGMTFQEKRLRARIDYAKLLLRTTDKTVAQIASLIGYANESSFVLLAV